MEHAGHPDVEITAELLDIAAGSAERLVRGHCRPDDGLPTADGRSAAGVVTRAGRRIRFKLRWTQTRQSARRLRSRSRHAPQSRVEKKDFDLLREKFKQVIAANFAGKADYEAWLTENLNSGVTLATRLIVLFEIHREIMDELVVNRGEFVTTAKKLRKAFAHGLAIGEFTFGDRRALFFLMEKLSVLFRACLLEELGVLCLVENHSFSSKSVVQTLAPIGALGMVLVARTHTDGGPNPGVVWPRACASSGQIRTERPITAASPTKDGRPSRTIFSVFSTV